MESRSLLYPELESVNISLLAENTARGTGICGEHGLSWWIESAGQQLVFDLGQGMVVPGNADRLGIDLKTADAVVFSHGHHDHVGGWIRLSEYFKEAPVYLHPSALELKFSKLGGGLMKSAGVEEFPGMLKRREASVFESTDPMEVLPGIWTTGEIPRVTDYEDTGGAFYHLEGATEEDPLLDDMSLFFNTKKGIVVVLGCAHAGIVNILRHIQNLTGRNIHAIMGGTHMLTASKERIDKTIGELRAMDLDWMAPNHCTGDAPVACFWNAFPEKMHEMHAGQSAKFPYMGG